MNLLLVCSAVIKLLFGLLLMCLLLFLPAGTFLFFRAWLMIALLFVPMLLLGVVLLVKAPKLLERRLDAKEKEMTQKGVVAFSGLLFVLGFVLAGLDFRFGWSRFSPGITVFGSALLLLSYGLYAEVMRENVYLSRTVKVEEGQTLVDSGLYGIVRHPMYAATLLLFLSFALVLGSLWTFLCFLGFIPLFVIRILNEEKLLVKELQGYREYCERVTYRLIPFIW